MKYGTYRVTRKGGVEDGKKKYTNETVLTDPLIRPTLTGNLGDGFLVTNLCMQRHLNAFQYKVGHYI